MKKISLVSLFLLLTLPICFAADVTVNFSGLESGDKANLTIASSTYLESLPITDNGTYVFKNVPEGNHFVKAEAAGYNVIEALKVTVNADGTVNPSVPLKIPVTKMSENPDQWSFEWKEDGSPSGYTTSSNVNKPAEIEFLGKMIVPADVPSFGILENTYHIILADDEKEWTQEYAYRIVETLKTLPCDYYNAKPAKFTLTDSHLTDDINVTDLGEGYEVSISEDVFYYANPFLVNLDGIRGQLYSKRLHHALTNFVTDFGQNTWLVDQILFNRFGCHILDVNYEELTRGVTDEDAYCFQQFHPTELVSIINMLEELPEGFHKTPHLNYLIRRQDGHKHPIYPEAAAVSWCQDNGYIEFMENTFGGNNQGFETLRLILHEKTHFLWAFTFSEEIKNAWIEIGGWYRDPNSDEGWSTTKDAEFVTQYAHGKNPNEDMAESIAFYLKDPGLLMSRSIEKYEFIRDRIMHGVRYISTVPDHLSFEVLNLWPDYDYPGKIKRVNVTVDGEAEADKLLNIEIEINHIEGYQDGASHGFSRVTSPDFFDENGEKHNQFVDIHLYPVDGNPYILRGSTEISRYSKMGHWTAGDITLSDLQGNSRYEGRNDCVVDVYVNNPLEDLIPAVYEPGSLEYELSDTIVEGHHCQNLKITYKVTDNVGIASTFARIYAESEGFNGGGTGLTDQYGTYDPETHIAEINFLIPDYFPTTYYYLPFIEFHDLAHTETRVEFSESPEHQPVKKIYIETPTPDTTHPEIDLNRLFVYAEPTHPEAPDGETKVTINFYVRDDISGFGPSYYHFIDPQGVLHGNYWYYHRNSSTTFFDGDPTIWEHHQIIHILPQGSAPGRWGLAQMMVSDKAGNEYTYNFVETLIFEPDNDMSKYVFFADMDDSGMLYLTLSSESGSLFGFNYRVIHEETGQEIDGNVSAANEGTTRGFAAGERSDAKIDISDLPDGTIIVIANILDENGQIETAKSAKINKDTTVKASGISLSFSEVEITEDEKTTLVATIVPEDTTDKTVTWSSSDEKVATVEDGVVTAINPGEATITAATTDGSGISAVCHVTVNPVLVESISLNPEEWSGTEGDSFLIEASIYPENASNKALEWSSTDELVAVVNHEGFVNVVHEGTCIIKVSALDGSGVTAECIVTSTSGIDSIYSDEDIFDVFDYNGSLIKKDCDRKYLKHMIPGIYIIKKGNKTSKVVIR